MFRIRRVIASGVVTLIVSGRIGAGDVPGLRDLIAAERDADVVLDLTEVSLVDVEAVRFLVHCEARGVRLAHAPAYIREWMRRENGRSSE